MSTLTPTPTNTVPPPNSSAPSATPYNPYRPSQTQTAGGVFGGSSPPSIYLICFIVIILVLLLISSLLALRTINHRRRLHAAWARTGYADAFFDTTYYRENAPRGGLSAAQRWGVYSFETLGGGNRARMTSREGRYGTKPVVWEIEGLEEEEEQNEKEQGWGVHQRQETDATMVGTGTWGRGGEKGKGRAPSRYDELPRGWEAIMPISTSLLLPPPPPPSTKNSSSSSSSPDAPITHTPPTFWATIRTVPMRPPPPPPTPAPEPLPMSEILDTPTWPAAAHHTSPPSSSSSSSAPAAAATYYGASSSSTARGGASKELEVSVLIALPMEPGWEDKLDRDDGEKELPDVAIGVAKVRLSAPGGSW